MSTSPPPPPPTTPVSPPPATPGSLPPPGGSGGGVINWLVVGLSIGWMAVLVVVCCLFLCCRKRKRRRDDEAGYYIPPSPPGPKGSRIPLPPPPPGIALGFSKSTFAHEELARATDGCSDSNLLGQGGFAYVHRGVLPNGKEVAIKQLKAGSAQGEREFQAEVEIISRVHHKHLVSLVGYCIAGSQRMLVMNSFQTTL